MLAGEGFLTKLLPAHFRLCRLKKQEAITVFIGPHIFKDTFEFDRAPAQKFADLAKSLGLQDIESIVSPTSHDHDKVTVDLTRLAKAQVHVTCPWAEIIQLPVNTYVDNNFCSFRRERVAGRNLSFVARLKA